MAADGKRALAPWEIAARRRNAQRSTGPRTSAGKRRSALNALRSGEHARLLGGGKWFLAKDPPEFRRLHCALLALLGPVDGWDLAFLMHHLAQEFWWKWCLTGRDPKTGYPEIMQSDETRLEEWLETLLASLAARSRKWQSRLAAILGGQFDSLAELCDLLESRLPLPREPVAQDISPILRAILGGNKGSLKRSQDSPYPIDSKNSHDTMPEKRTQLLYHLYFQIDNP